MTRPQDDPAPPPAPPSRRDFLRKMGGWAAGVLASAAALDARAGFLPNPGYPRRPLPGACLPAATDIERTLAAILDAVVPGAESDPDGTPGAVEACAMNLLLDGAYPFRDYAPAIVALMDALAESAHGAPFATLGLAERVEVLVTAQETLPLLRLAYRAIRSAFYGGAYNGVGLDYVGYPGPNLGYRHLHAFSFRRPVCTELTEGWMP
ncbi:MAG: hypothetical protein EP329_21735 [Deltaproteobacteria bacterium]|nr:MAG: hypothetical protein EP329_21735 [Deltaproteobacteria bacterium]